MFARLNLIDGGHWTGGSDAAFRRKNSSQKYTTQI